MLTLSLPDNVRVNEIYALPTVGWLLKISNSERGYFTVGKPVVVKPTGEMICYEHAGHFQTRATNTKNIFVFCPYPDVKDVRFFYVGTDGMLTKSSTRPLFDPYRQRKEKYTIAQYHGTGYKINDHWSSDNAAAAMLRLAAGITKGKYGLGVYRAADDETKILVFDFEVGLPKVSEDGATIIFCDKNKLHIIDNPLYE